MEIQSNSTKQQQSKAKQGRQTALTFRDSLILASNIRSEQRSTGIHVHVSDASSAVELLSNNADGVAVHHSPQVMASLKRVLNADEVPLTAHSLSPLLLTLTAHSNTAHNPKLNHAA